MNRWWFVTNFKVEPNKTYTARAYVKVPVTTEGTSGKYYFAVKRSAETLSEAITSGHFMVLDPWWNASWSRKRPIHINNTGGSALTDYQVMLNITYDSDMNSDFSDIRIVNETSGETVPYWIEDKVDGSWCKIWFNASYIPANSWCNDTYYLYYGNPSASSASDGDATFEFFDDFDTDTSSQYTVIGYPTSGEFTIEPENSWAKTDTSNIHMAWKSSTNFSERGYIVEAETKTDDDDGIGVGWLQSDGKGYAGTVREDTGFNGGIFKKNDTSSGFDSPDSALSSEPSAVTHHWYYVKLSVTNNNVLLYVKDLEGSYEADASLSDTAYISGCPALISAANTPEAYYKYLRVRKYASPEPSAELGTEEEQQDTSFTVSLPAGYTYAHFNLTGVEGASTKTNYPPEGQSDSQPFYKISNTGNVNLTVKMKINATIPNVILKADTDNNPSGAKEINTTYAVLCEDLPPNEYLNVWLWTDLSHAEEQETERELAIAVSSIYGEFPYTFPITLG